MKNHIRRLTAILLMLLYVTVFSISAFADGSDTVSTEIPISVSVEHAEGEEAPKEIYTFKLEAIADAPMPVNDTVTIEGAGNAKFDLTYTTVGEYEYKVTQDASDLTGENSSADNRGHYDSTVYYVRVTVTNNVNGGIEAVVHAYKDGFEGNKQNIEFVNSYDPLSYDSLTVNKEWKDNKSTRPSSIKVQLLDGDKVVETVTLTATTEWTYTWDKLDTTEDHKWDVKELNVSGYTPTYTTEKDGSITILNTGTSSGGGSLIQTGQLNWPIRILLGAGCLLVIGGAYSLTRKKEQNNE